MKITVKQYLDKTAELLSKGQRTDGCTSPFKTYIHRWLSHARVLCAAHDFGGEGLIPGVRPGWHNNWITWLTHISQPNPVYWIWGTVVAVVTLPWVIWRRNWGIKFMDIAAFYIVLIIIIILPILIHYR